MKIREEGRGGQKKCTPKLRNPTSPPLLLSSSSLSAGRAWNEERGKG